MNIQRTFGLFCFLAACGVAGAKPSVKAPINGNHQRITVALRNESFVVNGNDNIIHLHGKGIALTVNGNRNTITVDNVKIIVVSGNKNRVMWKQAKNVNNLGSGNTLVHLKK